SLSPQHYVEGLSAYYGTSVDEQIFIEAGYRALAVEQYLNLLYGFDASSDRLPRKFLEEPVPKGKHMGAVCPLDLLLKHYRKNLRTNDVSKHLSKFPKLS
ncbi:MAG: aldehyde ferredoxin oxidoreductase C-terminal domain-containing protein, partial [Candidatus Caldarchaeum sp.]|nr:aldehyde ferredoxin oxidoreductase C-terminal domain-containing protein [Candidatus Caldarchaeum sp.]